MNQNHFLSVAEFMACPYGNSSKLAHTPHANDLFDTRHHFIITPETSHLGLFATFVNEGALRPHLAACIATSTSACWKSHKAGSEKSLRGG